MLWSIVEIQGQVSSEGYKKGLRGVFFLELASKEEFLHNLSFKCQLSVGYIKFWKMNMYHLLNKPYVNEVTLREQNWF